jgi:hypothetical protein
MAGDGREWVRSSCETTFFKVSDIELLIIEGNWKNREICFRCHYRTGN